jgi:hypothetical protein
MIVISDGDLIRNQLDKKSKSGWDTINVPKLMTTGFHAELCQLPFRRYGLINIQQRSGLAFIRQRKGFANYGKTQVITIRLPLLLVLFGVVYVPKKKKIRSVDVNKKFQY